MLRRLWCALRSHPYVRVTITEVVSTGAVRRSHSRTTCDHCGAEVPSRLSAR